MKYLILVGLLSCLLFLTSCGAVTGSIDLGFVKIPMILVFAAIIIYIIYRRNHK